VIPGLGIISPSDLTGAVWECEPVSESVEEAKLLYYLSRVLIALGL
jgi:hypothetical protein